MRAMQRYGLALNRHDYQQLVKRIQRNEGKFLLRESNRLTHWQIDVEGQDVVVVYDKKRATIVTFLPPEAIKGY